MAYSGESGNMDSILIVHQSKVIRATLTRYLEAHFEIFEAQDSESAWQILVLHHGVAAVISGLDISQSSESISWATSTRISGIDSQLSGMDLLDRLRNNSLPRLRQLPFYFIGSETHIAEITLEARRHKVTDFLFNGMSKPEILAKLNYHEKPMIGETTLPTQESSITNLRRAGILSVNLFRNAAHRVFDRSGTQGVLIIFGIDAYDEIVGKLGKKAAESILDKFANLVLSKIKADDLIGHCGPGRFAIAVPGASLASCKAFAHRVVKGLSSAKISVEGKPLQISASFGVASRPEDGDLSGEALLDLATTRLEEAGAAGDR
jgi:diguanylate cyclase (GGDEF)-like protein